MMRKPKVSICVPTYNRSKHLRRTIESVLSQTFQNLELIICDDASIDDTEAVVHSYSDPRILYHRNERNLGLYENWHIGLNLVSGEYIAIYHDHDLYLPTIVEQSVNMLDTYPSASFVHTALYMIDENDQSVALDVRPFKELTSGWRLRDSLARSWNSPVMAPTAMVRRQAYERVGSRYEHQRYGQDCDLNMWFRLTEVGDVAYISTPQVYIRTRIKGQTTAQFRWSDVVGDLRMREDHIQAAWGNHPIKYALSKCEYALARDIRLSILFCRALLKEGSSVIVEGRYIVSNECTPVIKSLLLTIASSKVLQKIMENTLLPLHYWRVKRRQAKQRAQAEPFRAMTSSIYE